VVDQRQERAGEASPVAQGSDLIGECRPAGRRQLVSEAPDIERSGSRGNRSGAVPVKTNPPKRERFLPRIKGIYHVGCTDYPDPTYP